MGFLRESKVDKVCNTCGGIGFNLFTCFMCKEISEHSYCMRKQVDGVPQTWYCDECLGDAYSDRSDDTSDCECIDMYEKQTVKSKASKVGSFEIQKSRKQKRSSVAGLPPEKKLSVSRGPSKATKVKMKPAEEVALLTYARARNTQVSMHRQTKVTQRGARGSAPALVTPTVKERLSSNNRVDKEHDLIGKEGKKQKNEASVLGKEASDVHCLRGTTDISIGAGVGPVPAKGSAVEKTRSDYSSPFPCTKTGSSMRASEQDPEMPIKTSVNAELCTYQKRVRLVESVCVARATSDVVQNVTMDVNDSAGHTILAMPSQECDFRATPVNANTQLGSPHIGLAENFSPSETSGFQVPKRPLLLLINSDDRLLDHPVQEACWRGTFHVLDKDFYCFSGIQAHFPGKVAVKVYEIMKQMAQTLELKVMPRLHLWPKIFQRNPPSCNDIGLFFLPCRLERSEKDYISLLEHIDSHDAALWCHMDDVDLLVYTSKQLPAASSRLNMETYLWGIFRHAKGKQLSQVTETSCTPECSWRQKIHDQSNVSQKSSMEVDNLEGGSRPTPVSAPGGHPRLRTFAGNVEVDKQVNVFPSFTKPLEESDLKGMGSSRPTYDASCKSSKLLESNSMERTGKPTSDAILDTPISREQLNVENIEKIGSHIPVPRIDVSDVPAKPYGDNCMEKITRPTRVPEFPVPPGFAKPNVRKSEQKRTSRQLIIPSMPDAPPGFPTPYAWKIKSCPFEAIQSCPTPSINSVPSTTVTEASTLQANHKQAADRKKKHVQWEYKAGEAKEKDRGGFR